VYSPRDPVAEYWRGEITLRKLRVLISGLPPGGIAYRAVNGHGWTEPEALLADLIDATNRVSHSVFKAQAGKRHVREPRRYPRPGDRPGFDRIGDRGGRSTEDVVSYLDSLKPPEG
jgi:hypothetical protein